MERMPLSTISFFVGLVSLISVGLGMQNYKFPVKSPKPKPLNSKKGADVCGGAAEGGQIVRADACEGSFQARAHGEDYDGGVEYSCGDDKHVGSQCPLIGDVALVGACLGAEAHGVECGREAREHVEDVEVFLRTQKAEQEQDVGGEGQAIWRERYEEVACVRAAVANASFARAGGERVDASHEHEAYGRVCQFVAEHLHPAFVLAENAELPQTGVGGDASGEPQVVAPVRADARHGGRCGEKPEDEPACNQRIACDAECFHSLAERRLKRCSQASSRRSRTSSKPSAPS